jgi:D-aspartate ligase
MRRVGHPSALACVIGSMDLVRPLGLAGVRCAVVARPHSRARYSRFTVDAIDWADPTREPDVLLDRLLVFGRTHSEPPVLYYDRDAVLLLLSRRRDELAGVFRLVLPERELVEQLVDKGRFAALAAEAGLPVPPTHRIPAGAEGESIDFDFPLVVKPINRDIASWDTVGGGGKALPVYDVSTLRTALRQLGECGIDVLVQELIEGPESRIESYHAYVDESGAIAGDFTGRKTRTHPATNGFSSALEITVARDVADLGRDVLARLGLRGVAKVDFKRDSAGRLHLLEVNPRFNLWHHPGAVAGVNIPALVYADAVGLPRPPSGPVRAGVRWCRPGRDMRARRAAGIGLAPWFLWFLTCESKSGGLALDDPGPAVRGTLDRTAAAVAHALRSKAPKRRLIADPSR